MIRINGNALRRYRVNGGFTLEALEAAAKVSKGTINKMECGKRPSARLNTIEQLARALGIKKELLLQEGTTGSTAASEPAAPESSFGSEMKVVINDGCRNALFLASLRFHIPEREIINLAPFLFVWAAETSLRRRKEALNEITRKLDEIAEIRKSQLPHLSHRLHSSVDVESHTSSEHNSILTRDLFGRKVEEDDSDITPILADNFDDERSNPFIAFLKVLAADVPEVAEFEGMSSFGWPDYYVCRDQALLIVGGDQVAAEIILDGRAPLHLMPPDIRGKGKGSERAAWAKAKSEERSQDSQFEL